MLFVHGFAGPLRLVEEIRYWKMQERENAAFLRMAGGWGASPEWLAAWEDALQEMEAAASGWLEASLHGGVPARNAEAEEQLEALVAGAAAQSQRWAGALLELSRLNGGTGPAAHMARDSEYFLGILNGMTRSGLLPEGSWMASFEQQPSPGPVPAPVPVGGHILPPLPYAYDALTPHLDRETIRIHHDILHKNYVEGLNIAERKLAEARQTGDFNLVKHWERELAFNGAGHYLHTVYFYGMDPNGGGMPSGDLARQIANDFGGYEPFQQHFSKAAEKVEGSGWAILVWSPRAGRLQILQAEKHQNLTQWDDVPLLALDVWEHSYYLSYKNDRAKYIDAWFQVVNWPYAANRYMEARGLHWKPY